MKRLFRRPLIRTVAVALLAGVLPLALTGCELFGGESGVSGQIKQETGLDVNSPAQVATAALGASVLGNKDATDALDVVKGFQRAKWEQKGDNHFSAGQQTVARSDYETALTWADSSTAAGKKKTAWLYIKIGFTYIEQSLHAQLAAARTNDLGAKASLYRLSAQKFRSAAAWAGKAADMDKEENYQADKNTWLSMAEQDDRVAAELEKKAKSG